MPGHFACALVLAALKRVYCPLVSHELTSDAQYKFGDSGTNGVRVDMHGFFVASTEKCKMFGSP